MFAAILGYKLRTVLEPIPGIKLPFDISSFQPFNEYIKFSLILSIALIIIFALSKMYSMKSAATIWRELYKIFIATTIWLMAIITYFFIIREFPFSRLALGYSWILTILFVSAGRIIIKIIQNFFLRFDVGKMNVLVLGETETALMLKNGLLNKKEYKIIDEKINSMEDLEKISKKIKIDEIIQSKSGLSKMDVLEFCKENQISYKFVPDLMETQQINIDFAEINNIPVITLKPTPLDGWGRVIKRTFDIFGSGLGLAVASPFMFLTAIFIKTTSSGPILFSRKDNGSPVLRIGQYGKPFRFYKFRTMRPNTDSLRYTELSHLNTRTNSPLVKIKNDPRITSFGKFLRKTSIDELPQLWSVLKGNMSLVGPRPHLPEEVEKYKKQHRFVFTIKPGITGVAQVKGRSDLDFETEIKLDTYYIQNWSLWMDIKILFKTLFAILRSYEE